MTEAAPAASDLLQQPGTPPPVTPADSAKHTIKAIIHYGPGVTPPEGVAAVSNVDAMRERMVETFRGFGVDEAVLEQQRARTPVSQKEFDLAMHRKNILTQDKAWISRYFAGGAAEKKEFATLHIILGSDIKRDDNNA
jgi:hypothetical protein